MTITTTQITADEVLQAVADGKQIQKVLKIADEYTFFNFNQKISDLMGNADAWLIVEAEDEITEEIAESQQNITDTCENAAKEDVPETIVTDPDTTPITVEIPNSQKSKKIARWQLNDDEILRLRKDGLSERQIADRLDVTQPTIHNHIQKMKREGRL